MSINFRDVNNLEVLNKLNSGDKLLVNSGGVAKQIDASMLGGGGADPIYATLESEDGNNFVRVYTDETLTEMMSYEDAKYKLSRGSALFGTLNGITASVMPVTIVPIDESKMLRTIIIVDALIVYMVVCKDSIA